MKDGERRDGGADDGNGDFSINAEFRQAVNPPRISRSFGTPRNA